MKHYFVSYASTNGFGRTAVMVPEGGHLYIKGLEEEIAKSIEREWVSVLYFTEISPQISRGLGKVEGAKVEPLHGFPGDAHE